MTPSVEQGPRLRAAYRRGWLPGNPSPRRLLIRGATVVDGTGRRRTSREVGVADGRIVCVSARCPDDNWDEVFDAGGLVLAPGFIDLHSHADFTLPAFPSALNSISQGVTTEIVGNCGYSPAPVSPDPERATELRREARSIGPNLAWDWQTFGEYLDRLDAARPAVNVIPLVGHGALRIAAMGLEDRPASRTEVDHMRHALAQALAEGAWGLSTGLVYRPGASSNTDEVVAVGEPLRGVDGIYASHIRNESDRLGPAVDEAIEIGRRLGVRVEISHLKAAGRANHGRVIEALDRIEAARAEGRAVGCDVYPYTAIGTFLSQLLPPWAEAGGGQSIVERLQSIEMRARIRADIESGLPGWNNYVAGVGGWEQIRVSSVADPDLRPLQNRSLADLAAEGNSDPLTFALDLLARDPVGTNMVVFLMSDADVEAVIASPISAIGSDQYAVVSDEAHVHPRSWGTFARVLGHYVRERSVLGLETAIHKMTGLPAMMFGLRDRGLIREGHTADLVLFDPLIVEDRATYAEPTRRARGVETVLLGGHFAVRAGEIVDARLGRVLRRPKRIVRA